MNTLKNKRIFITGASGLIGSFIINRLISEGAEIHYCKRNEIKNISGRNVFYYNVDLSSELSINNLISKLSTNDLCFSGFVHCAWSRPAQENYSKKDEYFLKSVIDNSRSLYLLSEFFTKNLIKSKSSSIVYIGSIYGIVAPDFEIYKNTEMHTELEYQYLKFGMNGLSKYYSSLYGKYGLRSNVIILGGIENNQPKSFIKQYIEKTSLKRMGTPKDVDGPVVFLLSDESKYITGSLLTVDGGYTSR